MPVTGAQVQHESNAIGKNEGTYRCASHMGTKLYGISHLNNEVGQSEGREGMISEKRVLRRE